MRRLLCAVCAALLLSGCSTLPAFSHNTTTFYYMRKNYREDLSSPIGSEIRETPERKKEIGYALALYLMGPSTDGLVSPLPAGTQVLALERGSSDITITITDTTATLKESDFTLACACLSLTIMDLTDVQQVTVFSGDRSATINRSNLYYIDETPLQPTETEAVS